MAEAIAQEALLVDLLLPIALILRVDPEAESLQVAPRKAEAGKQVPQRLRVLGGMLQGVAVFRIDALQRHGDPGGVGLQLQLAFAGHVNGSHGFSPFMIAKSAPLCAVKTE